MEKAVKPAAGVNPMGAAITAFAAKVRPGLASNSADYVNSIEALIRPHK